MKQMLFIVISVLGLLSLSLIRTTETSAQGNQSALTPTPGPLFAFEIDVVTQPQLISSDRLAPGCELTSPEAGVYQVVCNEDVPPTTSIPTVNGELLAPGCELTNPEAGVFILDCTPDPAEPIVPGLPGMITIQPGGISENTPTDRAPQAGVCDGAASSYVEPGMEVIRNTLITFDDLVYSNQDEEVVFYALYGLDATQLAMLRNRFDSLGSGNSVGPFSDGDIVTIGENNTCLSIGNFTLRFWQLDTGEWVVDTVAAHEVLDISQIWPQQPIPQNVSEILAPPANPMLVDGLVFRYLMPYIEPPITTMPGANQVDTDLPTSYACEYAAPSYLAVGMDVMLSSYGYERMPQLFSEPDWLTWTFQDTHFALSDHGMATHIDILNNTPLANLPGNLEAVVLSPAELLSNGTTFTTGTILSGPYCREVMAKPPESCSVCTTLPCQPCTSGTGFKPDRFFTWWEVVITTNGQTYQGYYPENVGQYSYWLWETNGIFPRKLFMYYMQPIALMTQPHPSSQDTVAPPVSQPTQVPPTIAPVQVQPTQVPPMPTTRPTQAPPTPMPIITPIQIQPTSTPIQVQPIMPIATPTPR